MIFSIGMNGLAGGLLSVVWSMSLGTSLKGVTVGDMGSLVSGILTHATLSFMVKVLVGESGFSC